MEQQNLLIGWKSIVLCLQEPHSGLTNFGHRVALHQVTDSGGKHIDRPLHIVNEEIQQKLPTCLHATTWRWDRCWCFRVTRGRPFGLQFGWCRDRKCWFQPIQWLTPLLTRQLTWQFPIVDGPPNLSWELVVTIVDGLADQGIMSILYGLAESYGWGSLTGWLRTVRDVLTPSYTDKLN
jgi:hypothetical protein